MHCDLEKYFGDLANQVPSEAETEFVFSVKTLPQPPAQLQTDSFFIKKGQHSYQSYVNAQADLLSFQAHKRTYKLLGLLVLAKVFHMTASEIHLRLLHPTSEIHEIVLDYEPTVGNLVFAPGYQTRPYQFTYWPEKLKLFPLADSQVPQQALPLFNLTNANNSVGGNEAEWKERDTVRCAGTDQGNILFASVLLNLGRPEEICNEVTLEGELGYGGVGLGSAEVRLWLPGSPGWEGEV